MAKSKKARVKEELIEQLARKGADISPFLDQVDTYMELWDIKRSLKADIRKKGTSYEEISTAGNPIWKSNPANRDLVSVSRQMTAILRELNITTDSIEAEDDDEL